MPEVHLTFGALLLLVGAVPILLGIGYAVGRFNQRLTTVESNMELFLRRLLDILERIAASLEDRTGGPA